MTEDQYDKPTKSEKRYLKKIEKELTLDSELKFWPDPGQIADVETVIMKNWSHLNDVLHIDSPWRIGSISKTNKRQAKKDTAEINKFLRWLRKLKGRNCQVGIIPRDNCLYVTIPEGQDMLSMLKITDLLLEASPPDFDRKGNTYALIWK